MTLRLPILQSGADMVPVTPFKLPSIERPRGAPVLGLSRPELEERDNLRTSSYTIYVDLPDNPDEMLLVHGYTGAYDQVSKRVATYLRSLEGRHAPKPLYGHWTPEPSIEHDGIVKPSDETIATLAQRGYLVALTPEEEEALFVEICTRLHNETICSAPGYVLMPTYQCNLRCAYCFQDHMRSDPSFAHLLRVMDEPMVDRIIDGMGRIEAGHGIADDDEIRRQITFFGGEPLLASSRSIVEYIMNRVRERGPAAFDAITNATELDAYRKLLGPEGIRRIQVTVDGPRDEHDQRRIYPDGTGSFDRIARNIELALECGAIVSMRMNIATGPTFNIYQL